MPTVATKFVPLNSVIIVVMTAPIDVETDKQVRALFLGNLNKVRTLLATSDISNTFVDDLDRLIDELQHTLVDDDINRVFASKNKQIRDVYLGIKQLNQSVPANRRHAEMVRRSLINQQYKSNPPQPWFDRQFFQIVSDKERDTLTADPSARASLIFEMLFPFERDLQLDGIPRFEDTESVLKRLANTTYGDATTQWQKGQIFRMIRENEITMKSSNSVVNRLMNMSDVQLSDTLKQVIDESLQDLGRRSADVKKRNSDIDETFKRIEELWAQRPTLKYSQEKQPLYKRLDQYLFESNIENFLRRFIGPKTPEEPPPLPVNPQRDLGNGLTASPKVQLWKSSQLSSQVSSQQNMIDDVDEVILKPSLNSFTSVTNEDSRTLPLVFQNMSSQYDEKEQKPNTPVSYSAQQSTLPIISSSQTTPVGCIRNVRRISFSSPVEKAELERHLQISWGAITPALDMNWQTDKVDITFMNETQASQLLQPVADDSRFQIRYVPNPRYEEFLKLYKDYPLPPTDPTSTNKLEISQIDINKVRDMVASQRIGSVDSARAIFNIASAIAGLSRLSIDFFEFDAGESSFQIGFKNAAHAAVFQNDFETTDIKNIWQDYFGEWIKMQKPTSSDTTKVTTNNKAKSSSAAPTANDKTKSKIKITNVGKLEPKTLKAFLRDANEKARTKLSFRLPDMSKNPITIDLTTPEKATQFRNAILKLDPNQKKVESFYV